MSTKAIKEALNRLRRLERFGDGEFERIDAAEAEVEAIEKAALTLELCQIGYSRGVTKQAEAEAAYAVIHSIAAQRNAGTAGLSDGLSGVRFGAGVIKDGARGPQE